MGTTVRKLLIIFGIAIATLLGGVTAPNTANAAQNNSFSVYYNNPKCNAQKCFQ